MNTIAWIVLVAVLLDFFVSRFAEYLNLKSLKDELPEAFDGVFKPDEYRRSQEYLAVNTRFQWLVSTFNLLVLLCFWHIGGFRMLDDWVSGPVTGPVLSGLLFIGLLAIAHFVIGLPFELYQTFVIEERFGFNKMTKRVFATDMLKTLALTVVLGGPVLAVVLLFFDVAGGFAWVYCWGVVTLYTLIIQFVAPTWIMPLFNKFTPLEEGELRDALFAYAKKIEFPLDNIYVMDGSRRSSKANAFFTGFGKNRRIVLFDTLIKKHTPEELLAILAHEMGHYKKGHIVRMMVFGIVQMGLMFFLLSVAISYQGLFEAFYINRPSVYAGLVFFGILYSPFDAITGVAVQAISRKHEYEADRFAADTTNAPEKLAEALKKLSADSLSNLFPHPFYVLLNYSHPPIMKRLAALDEAGNAE